MDASSTISSNDTDSLDKRVRQEIEAALRCNDAKAAAAHVELANRYLVEMSASREDDAT